MIRSNFSKLCLILVLALTPLFFMGCGGGGGSDDSDNGGGATNAAVVDETSVNKSMVFVEETIPGCQMVEATEIAAGVMGSRTISNQSGALVSLFNTLAAARNQTTENLTSIAIEPQIIEGDCGGTMTITSAHLDGVTTVTLLCNNFCSPDETTDPPGEIKINGKLIVKEVGTPSDLGPVISKYTAATEGELTVVTDADQVSLTLNNFAYTFGSPGVEPGVPTQSNPDQVTMGQLTVNFVTQNRVITIANLNATSYESGDNDVIAMSSGRFSISDKGYVDVSTSQPLIMNSDGDLVSGEVVFEGANDNVVTVTSGGESGTFSLKLNGEPMDKGMDCSAIGLDDIPL
jgi:hypothetical protein